MAELRISELARRSGVSASALRYYGDIGLLPAARTPSGYRAYDEHAEERLRFITAAKRLELSLPAIRELLAVWDTDTCRSVKGELRPLLDARIAEAEESIAALTDLRDSLRGARDRLDALPDRDDRCDPGCAFLLDAPAPTPVACALDGPEYAARLRQWRDLARECPPRRGERELRFEAPGERAAELAALAVAERQCCAFLEFELTVGQATVTLTVTAPAGAEQVLDVLVSGAAGSGTAGSDAVR
jgi:DNA-binding transcriptional MerR regulator